jgi:hypothetical protein
MGVRYICCHGGEVLERRVRAARGSVVSFIRCFCALSPTPRPAPV